MTTTFNTMYIDVSIVDDQLMGSEILGFSGFSGHTECVYPDIQYNSTNRYVFKGVESIEHCHQRCRDAASKDCAAWQFMYEENVCFLKGVDHGELVIRQGAISGPRECIRNGGFAG